MNQRSFYVTLDSLPTAEFPHNTNSVFQKRLPILLDMTRPGWRVAMSSLFLPDAGNQIMMESHGIRGDVDVVEIQLDSIDSDGDIGTQTIDITQKSIIDKVGIDATPRQIMRMIVGTYEYERLDRSRGLTYVHTVPSHPNLNRLDLQFKWKVNGDLLLDNSKTYLGSLGPNISFHVFIALKMKWLVKKGNGYELGPNLSYEILKHSDGTNRLATDLDAIWVGELQGRRPLTSYWGILKDKYLYISVAANWTFRVHSNTEQHDVQLLRIHSNIVESSIVNDTVSDLLAEVVYKRQDKGLIHIEPNIVRYTDVRLPYIDIVEISLLDSTGQPIRITGGKTSITLHFKRR